MVKSVEKLAEQTEHREEEEGVEEEEKSFEELGLDLRLVHALKKKGVEKPTLIQQYAVPRILVSFLYLNSNLPTYLIKSCFRIYLDCVHLFKSYV